MDLLISSGVIDLKWAPKMCFSLPLYLPKPPNHEFAVHLENLAHKIFITVILAIATTFATNSLANTSPTIESMDQLFLPVGYPCGDNNFSKTFCQFRYKLLPEIYINTIYGSEPPITLYGKSLVDNIFLYTHYTILKIL